MGCRKNRPQPSAREWGQGGVEGQEGGVEVEGGRVVEVERDWMCSLDLGGEGGEGEEIRVVSVDETIIALCLQFMSQSFDLTCHYRFYLVMT